MKFDSHPINQHYPIKRKLSIEHAHTDRSGLGVEVMFLESPPESDLRRRTIMATSSLAIGPSIDSCNLDSIREKHMSYTGTKKVGKGPKKGNFTKRDDGTPTPFVTFLRRNIYG